MLLRRHVWHTAVPIAKLRNLVLLTENLNTYSPSMLLGLIYTFSALLFEFGAASYKIWIGDVYEGAPTLVSLIFAVVPKIAVS